MHVQKQGSCIQGKAELALKNCKIMFGDQREDSITSLEACYCRIRQTIRTSVQVNTMY